MTVPAQDTNTTSTVSASDPSPAIATTNLDQDWLCDVDGSRMEVQERRVVGPITYSVRVCSANPNHTKMIPV